MIYIAICDDEKKIGAELERILIDIFGKLNVKCEIDVFFAGEELHKKMSAGAHYDLIFLDIEFREGEINGVEIGRLIRDVHKNHLVSIVYISWEIQYAFQLFKVYPLDFLIKPLEYEKLEGIARKYLEIARRNSQVFIYKKGRDTFNVQMKDIVYFENNDRKVIIHFADGKIDEFYGALKDIYEKQLKCVNFLFIHNSYIVNYDYVRALKPNQILLADSDESLPISQSRKNAVKDAYYAIIDGQGV
jgi:DNA-binding LytR/AlgR family response regulator